MSHFVITNSAGLITSVFTGTYNEALQTCHFLKLGYELVEVPKQPSPATEYIDGGALVARPKMQNVVAEGRVIHGLPKGSAVAVEGRTHTDLEGSVELEFNTPGPHVVTISAGAYLPEVLTLL